VDLFCTSYFFRLAASADYFSGSTETITDVADFFSFDSVFGFGF